MKTLTTFLAATAIACFTFCLTGCETSDPNANGGTTQNGSGDDGHGHAHGDQGHDDHAHDHSAKHGGHLIDLGRNHEYHAELVDNHDTDTVTIYISDDHMEPFATDQASLSVLLTSGDQSESFEFAAKADDSSEFSSKDPAMMKLFDADNIEGKIRITINDKPFTGTFDHHAHTPHNHDHDGDDHKHEEDHKHEGGHEHAEGK